MPMRPLLVIALAFFCLGTVWSYGRLADWLKPPPPRMVQQAAGGDFVVRVSFSYDQVEEGAENLLVILNGKTVFRSESMHLKSNVVEIRDLPVRKGDNRIHVSARAVSASEGQLQKNAAAFLLDEEVGEEDERFECIRVRVFRNGNQLSRADYTSHADGESIIIVDESFVVADTEQNGPAY